MIFGDASWPAESLGEFFQGDVDQSVSVFIEGKGWVQNKGIIARGALTTDSALHSAENLAIDETDESVQPLAIVGFADTELSQKIVEALRAKRKNIKILQVGSRGTRSALSQTKRSVAWKDLLSVGVDQEIQLLSFQDRVRDLRACFKDAEEVAILLQDDPDPDGLAAALALRKVLSRKSQTAPIISFGTITRPENVAMAKLLDIEIKQITEIELQGYERVVMLDCQPSFFKGRVVRADAIIDHHPRSPWSDDIKPKFVEIREDLGSVSTLMSFYLRAASEHISGRLATALLYGIKSDTLMLNREVSDFDLSAFVYLYPLTNGNTLRRIERPELPLGYLDSMRKGLRYMQVEQGVTVLPLITVEREEWIPQAADFALQVEGSYWAMGCGVFDNKVIISGRNCGYVQHCGELFKKLFNGLGCAGGHRTMAKAIIAKSDWESAFGKGSSSPAKIAEKIHELVTKVLLEREQMREASKDLKDSKDSENKITL